jgi:hypothetical protein
MGAGGLVATALGVSLSTASMRASASPRIVGIVIGLMPLIAAVLSFRANHLYRETAREYCDTAVARVEAWRDAHGKYPKDLKLVGIAHLYVPMRYDGYDSDGEGYGIGYVSDLCGNYGQRRMSGLREWHPHQIGL